MKPEPKSVNENILADTATVPCPICNSVLSSMFHRVHGYGVVRCVDCNFMFVNPRPTEQALFRLYSSRQENPYFSADFEPLEYELPVLKKITRFVRNYVPGGSLLEVGCGRGDFLGVAQMNGFSVTGCDLFGGRTPAVKGASLYDGTLREACFPDMSFDIAVVRNTFEHLFDPNMEIKEIRRILKENGYLYLKVPNGDFEHGLRCRLVFGKKCAFEPPYHLNYFNAVSLRRFLRNAGFEVTSWYFEQPTLRSRWTSNLVHQTGYRLIQAMRILSGGSVFPKPVLSCLARKMG